MFMHICLSLSDPFERLNRPDCPEKEVCGPGEIECGRMAVDKSE